MGRPREFDERQALEQAMQVFWTKGYEGTSLCDLMQAMGLSKSSLYDTFGSKNDLFVRAIEHYCETVQARYLGELRARHAELGSARAAIAGIFEATLEMAAGGETQRGCFLGNCAAEIAGQDPVATARVRAGMKAIENALYDVVKAGQDSGEIPAGRDARALARALTSSLNGLRTMAKLDPQEAGLRDIARLAVTVLD